MKYGKIIQGYVTIKPNIKYDFSEVVEITGYLYIRSEAKLPQLQTVGGGLYIWSGAKLEVRKNIKYDQVNAEKIALDFTFNCFLNLGFFWADGILAKFISKKQNKETTVYKVQILGQSKISYCVEVNGVYSHGDTIKEAKDSLIYKISNRDTSIYESFTLDTVVTFEDAVKMYHAITGACEGGMRHFCENVLRDKRKKYTVKEVIELTEGQYNNEKLGQFFSYNVAQLV